MKTETESFSCIKGAKRLRKQSESKGSLSRTEEKIRTEIVHLYTEY